MLSTEQLILWRHAQAETLTEHQQDLTRMLTHKGQQQAQRMGAWLTQHLPKNTTVLVSPAQRTIQTVAAWGGQYHILEALKPEAQAEQILAWLAHQAHTTPLMLVGHQPWLGELISYALTGSSQHSVPIQKGALWWLKRSKAGRQYEIYSVQTPKLVAKTT